MTFCRTEVRVTITCEAEVAEIHKMRSSSSGGEASASVCVIKISGVGKSRAAISVNN